jgi:hypothetical protein
MCGTPGAYVPCADQAQAQTDPTLAYWEPKYGARNSKRLPFYRQLDLRIDRLIRYNTWTMNLYLDVYNIAMSENVMSYDYGKDYEDFQNPKTSGFPGFPLPFFGVEASF